MRGASHGVFVGLIYSSTSHKAAPHPRPPDEPNAPQFFSCHQVVISTDQSSEMFKEDESIIMLGQSGMSTPGILTSFALLLLCSS
jgi:hypothetical protein